MQVALGFFASKALLSATELGLFSELADGALTLETISSRLGLHARGARDFLDALVALGVLERHGNFYSNTPDSDEFLVRGKPEYIGGILEMANTRLYGFWGSLTEALKTGLPQNEAKPKQGGNQFDAIYSDPARLRQFLSAMTGLSVLAAQSLAAKFRWSEYGSFVDIGCAQGAVPVQLALAHPHLDARGFDLAEVGPVFKEYVAAFGLEDRVLFHPGSFFRDPLPSADVLIMGHILHDWDLDTKRMLVAKAYDALPSGGALVVYDCMIDDDRRQNSFGLLASLNMLIETPGGFDYTGAECRRWMREAGFRNTRVEHLLGPEFMALGVK
jgi:O-methyltransferase domain/Dimerisation domain